MAVTNPSGIDGRFVAFNLTKSKRGSKALTFKVGEHPFIKKYDSDVNFGDGRIVSLMNLQDQIARGNATPDAPMNLKMVERIVRFAKDHPAVSGKIQKMILAQWPL